MRKQVKVWMQQLLNCWIAYTIAAPVELDINAIIHLTRDYFGVFSLLTIFNKNSGFITVRVSERESAKPFEELAA